MDRGVISVQETMIEEHDNEVDALQIGELYLFHPHDPACPSSESLWGVYHGKEAGCPCLESCTLNQSDYLLWHIVPLTHRFARLATRNELRDYMYGLGLWEAMRRVGPRR